MIAHALLAVLAAARRFLRGTLDASVALALSSEDAPPMGELWRIQSALLP